MITDEQVEASRDAYDRVRMREAAPTRPISEWQPAAMRAALEAAERAAWQDISTAPNGSDHPYSKDDGSDPAEFVLVWNGYHQGVAYCTTRMWGSEGYDWLDETGVEVDPPPTHWRPLPAGPSS